MNSVLGVLQEEALSFLKSNAVAPEKRELHFSVDARYHSQPWDLTVPLRTGTLRDKSDVETHETLRGSREEGEFVVCSTWRVKAVGVTRPLDLLEEGLSGDSPAENAMVGRRGAYFPSLGGVVETPVYDGHELKPGNSIPSPAIIEHTETILVVFPGSCVKVSRLGNYVIHMER